MNDTKIDRVLAAAPVEPLPRGFRDAVMARVTSQPSTSWEWIVAAALAIPSLAYVAWVVAAYGADFVSAFADIARVAQGVQLDSTPVFFIDGLVVLAVALSGLASILAAHALLSSPPSQRTPFAR